MDYVSVTEAAEQLGVSRQSVWWRIKHGIINADRVGCYWFIPGSEVIRLMEAREVARREKFIGPRPYHKSRGVREAEIESQEGVIGK